MNPRVKASLALIFYFRILFPDSLSANSEFAYDAKNKTAVMMEPGGIRIWREGGQPQGHFQTISERAISPTVSIDGRYAAHGRISGDIIILRRQDDGTQGPVFKSHSLLTAGKKNSIGIAKIQFFMGTSKIAVARFDSIEIWDASSARLEKTYPIYSPAKSGPRGQTHSSENSCVSVIFFQSGGKRLAAICNTPDGKSAIWDVTKNTFQALEIPSGAIKDFSLDREGRRAIIVHAGVSVMDMGSGSLVSAPIPGADGFISATFNGPGDAMIFSGPSCRIAMADSRSFSMVALSPCWGGGRAKATISDDGKWLAAATSDRSFFKITLPPNEDWLPVAKSREITAAHQSWRTPDSGEIENFSGAGAFSADGRKLASVHKRGAITLWDVGEARILGIISTTSTIKSLSFCSHDHLMSADERGVVSEWLVPTSLSFGGTYARKSPIGITKADDVRCASDDTETLLSTIDGGVTMRRGNGREIVLAGPEFRSRGIARSPNREYLAAIGTAGIAHIWTTLGKEIGKTEAAAPGAVSMFFSPDSKYLAIGTDRGEVHLFAAPSGARRAALKGFQGNVGALAFSPDSQFVAALGGTSMFHIWDLRSWRRAPLSSGGIQPTAISFLPGGNGLAAADETGALHIFKFAGDGLLFKNVPDFSPPAGPMAPNGEDLGLVVSLGEYQNKILPRLDFAGRDADSIRDWLLTGLGIPGDRIAMLKDRKATKAGMEIQLGDWLRNHASTATRVFFYFSGVGMTDPVTGERFILPHDADPDFPQETALSFSRIKTLLSVVESRDIRIILDAGFGGMGPRSFHKEGGRPLVTVYDQSGRDDGRIMIIGAAEGGGIAMDDRASLHGFLTGTFLAGLSGNIDLDGNKSVSTRELILKLRQDYRRFPTKLPGEYSPLIWPKFEEGDDRWGRTWGPVLGTP